MAQEHEELVRLLSWKCDHCETLNPPHVMDCRTCSAPKKQHNEPHHPEFVKEKLSIHALFCSVQAIPEARVYRAELSGLLGIRVALFYGKIFSVSHVEHRQNRYVEPYNYEKRSGPFGMLRETVHVPSRYATEPVEETTGRAVATALLLLERALREAYVAIPKQYDWILQDENEWWYVLSETNTSEWGNYWGWIEHQMIERQHKPVKRRR